MEYIYIHLVGLLSIFQCDVKILAASAEIKVKVKEEKLIKKRLLKEKLLKEKD